MNAVQEQPVYFVNLPVLQPRAQLGLSWGSGDAPGSLVTQNAARWVQLEPGILRGS